MFAIGLGLFGENARAVSPIGTITTVTSNGDTTPITNTATAPNGATPFDNTGEDWDISFTGSDQDVANVVVGANTYQFVTLADELRLRRVDNASVSGIRDLVFCRGTVNDPAKTIACNGSTLKKMKSVLLGRSVNFGTDNIFTNVGSNSNNIERVDYIYKTGITIPLATPAADIGFIVLERGGNDTFKLAPILAVDGNFDPTLFGALLTVNTWGFSGFNYQSIVFRQDTGDADYRPSAELGIQDIDATFITFGGLGLSPGTTFYGYALFPTDVTNPNAPFTSFPTSSNDGLDLIEGGGFFQRVGSATFVDMEVLKTTSTPNLAPGGQALFRIVVRNLTQNQAVTNVDFEDVLPGEFSNISWRCQALGSGSTCLNGAQLANGTKSAFQNPAGNTINDKIDMAIGGRVVYEVTADLSMSARGLIDNTATVTADASAGQIVLSPANNSDTATITVQAPTEGDKFLYVLTDNNIELSRVFGNNTGDRENMNANSPETWRSNPDLVAPLEITGPLGLHVAFEERDGAGSYTFNFTISKVANNGGGATTQLATASVTQFLANNAVTLVTPVVTMNGALGYPIMLNPNDEIRLTVESNRRVRLYEIASTAIADRSRIEIPTNTVINVDSITFSPVAPEPGDTVTIRAVVSDPFGNADITGARLDLFNPSGSQVLNDQVMGVLSTTAATKTFTFNYNVPDYGTSQGDWRATITAIEGNEENPVTHTDSGIVTVGINELPQITVDKLVNGLSSEILDPGSYPDYLMTFTNVGPGEATQIVINIDIGEFLAFGVSSQAGQPFTYNDVGTPSLPTNFMGTPLVSLNGGPFQAMPISPVYRPDITAIQISMNGTMPVGASFTLRYQCLVE